MPSVPPTWVTLLEFFDVKSDATTEKSFCWVGGRSWACKQPCLVSSVAACERVAILGNQLSKRIPYWETSRTTIRNYLCMLQMMPSLRCNDAGKKCWKHLRCWWEAQGWVFHIALAFSKSADEAVQECAPSMQVAVAEDCKCLDL